MGIPWSGRKPSAGARWGFAAAVALLATVTAGCSEHGSRSVSPSDASGRDSEVAATPVAADAEAASDGEHKTDSASPDSPPPDTQRPDTMNGAPETADTLPDSRRGSDAGVDSFRIADSGADTGSPPDAAPDVGREAARDLTGDSVPGVADVYPTPDAGADPCVGGTTYADSTSARATIDGYGWVRLGVAASNQIVEFDTTMTVPETPAASGTLFLWPGLQPVMGAANYAALDNGVLQPVLTWGPTCAPNAPAQPYKSWWISGQYVNTYISSSSPNYAAYNGCHGGAGMNVAVGDVLDMRFVLRGTAWTQTVTNRRNAQSVSYTLDMLGQAQGSAEFVIEEYSSTPVSDVVFTSSVITFASAAKSSCQPAQRGTNDYFSAPRASSDGLHCCIDKVILRAQGVAATTPNSP